MQEVPDCASQNGGYLLNWFYDIIRIVRTNQYWSMKSLYPHLANSNTAIEDDTFSVAEYITFLNKTLRPHIVTIKGEISQVKDRGGAAIYFSLCDTSEKAVIDCLVWRNKLQYAGIDLKEGMEVKVVGYAEVYPPTGRLSFMAQQLAPVGEGALKLAFEKLKRELAHAGFFSQERKRKLPQYIHSIGLITSETAAAKKDFETHLGKHGYKVYFYDVRVEGVKAVNNLVGAIRWFNENKNDVELLVITRGGGSLESLHAFNTMEVAKAIYGSKIPVMTAIGHEQDLTIADLVADIRASVPTHAGKLISNPWDLAVNRIESMESSMLSLFKNKLQDMEVRLTQYQNNIFSCFAKHVAQCHKEVARYDASIVRCFREMLQKVKQLEMNFTWNYERFARRIAHAKQTVIYCEKAFEQEAMDWFANLMRMLIEHEKRLRLSDPQLKLKQGFSIVKDGTGKIIKSSKQVHQDDIIAIQLCDGTIDSTVKDVY